MRRNRIALFAVALLVAGCSGQPASEEAPAEKAGNGEQAVAEAPQIPEGAVHVGQPLEGKEPVRLAQVKSHPEDYFEKTILVEAVAQDVCQSKGCWMTIADGEGDPIWVAWGTGCGGKYAFPKDVGGKRVLVQGSFYEKEISPKDAEHLAEESKGLKAEDIAGRTFEMNATACIILPAAEGEGEKPAEKPAEA